MTQTRRWTRTVRQDRGDVRIAADVNVVLSTGGDTTADGSTGLGEGAGASPTHATSRQQVSITQSTRRTRRAAPTEETT